MSEGADAVTVAGTGLHSGVTSRVRLFRDDSHDDSHDEDSGGMIRFRRAGCEVAAGLEHVVATPRCTVLGADGVRVALVEHLLAALQIAGWWRGLVIELDADEVPILDGSAAPWLAALAELGTPPAPPEPLTAQTSWGYRDGGSRVGLEPGPARLCAEIDFAHPSVGQQRWCGSPDRYADLAGARTFGFLAEVEQLRQQGLIAGAGLENAIVFDEVGPLAPLRCPDEPVRHKALDFLGDSFLFGRPIAGRISVVRGSHRLHIEALRRLRADYASVM
ncbi:MAG: UDP-3-O-acyl-N-acetylglucosamine deacetylase [Trueperaceae bacterium]|nr:UDP-3-O-acyl-N-acetylglucosamine deacetylase [Trueperaceae bacterium]